MTPKVQHAHTATPSASHTEGVAFLHNALKKIRSPVPALFYFTQRPVATGSLPGHVPTPLMWQGYTKASSPYYTLLITESNAMANSLLPEAINTNHS